MKTKKILLILPLLLLSSCVLNTAPPAEPEFVVNFYMNASKEQISTYSGNLALADNLLYVQQRVRTGLRVQKPTDPERTNYEFGGWFKEAKCENLWDFDNEYVTCNTFLYAKWNREAGTEWNEPIYTAPKKIGDTYSVDTVLNIPVISGQVTLSTGAIKRLNENASDVRFAIGVTETNDNEMVSAEYDAGSKVITVTSKVNSSTIQVIDGTSNYVLNNSTYESKAAKYEENDKVAENHHIMLAGSSSMEFWETYKEDLDPIIAYNHGIGGTTVDQWKDDLVYRLLFPYSPKAAVFYVGVNNIINGEKEDGNDVGDKLTELFDLVHEHLPNTKLFYVLINKLPNYGSFQTQINKANNKMINYVVGKDWIENIDAGEGLLKPNGEPNVGYFRTDGLHMSSYGYVIWGGAIKNRLIAWMDKK